MLYNSPSYILFVQAICRLNIQYSSIFSYVNFYCRSWQKKLTTWILLLVSIAVSDLLVVTFSFIYSSWLVQYVDARLNIKYTSDIYCKVIIFLQQTSRCVSAWLVMVATLERVLCITTSVKRTMCTRKVTAVTICVLVLIGMCINAPQFLQMHGAPPLSNLLMCVAKPFPLHDLATWINITFSQIVPLTFMTIFNLFLLHFLIRYHADRSKKFTTDVTRCSANIKGQVDPKTVLQLTLVSIFYVIFETPYTISALFLKSAFESQVPLCDVKFYKALYDIIHAVSWLNHCNNFFLYILCNKKFRDLFVAKLSNPFKTIHINSPPNSV